LIPETSKTDSEINLRSKSRKRVMDGSETINPGARMMNPSLVKRKIAARSKSGRESPERTSEAGAEKGCCDGVAGYGSSTMVVREDGEAAARGDGGARLFGGDAIARVMP
jgi:hypothetical protein